MTVYAITDSKKGRTGIAPTYLQTIRELLLHRIFRSPLKRRTFAPEVQCMIIYTLFVLW